MQELERQSEWETTWPLHRSLSAGCLPAADKRVCAYVCVCRFPYCTYWSLSHSRIRRSTENINLISCWHKFQPWSRTIVQNQDISVTKTFLFLFTGRVSKTQTPCGPPTSILRWKKNFSRRKVTKKGREKELAWGTWDCFDYCVIQQKHFAHISH